MRWDAAREYVRGSLWVIPTLSVVAALLLSVVLTQVDVAPTSPLAFQGTADDARNLLIGITSTMVTVIALLLGLAVVALQLSSTQFSPRLLRNFLRDTGNQIVLGTFIATFLYCLLVLRTIHGYNDSIFVPNLSVSVGVALAVASIGVLIYFVHHVSVSIQADHIIAAVGADLDEAIERLYPERLGRADAEARPPNGGAYLPPDGIPGRSVIASSGRGYVQAVDTDGLMRITVENDIVVRLMRRPGQFVVRGATLAEAWPRARVQEDLARQIEGVFILGGQRTKTQDVLFAVDQLVQIAVRALSPGINDPFTAISCIDQLGAALCQLIERASPSACRYDDDGHLRVIAEPVAFAEVVDTAFDQIRQYGRASSAVTNHLLETIATISQLACTEEQRAALLRQAQMLARGSEEGLSEPLDRAAVSLRYRRVIQALERATAPRPERVER